VQNPEPPKTSGDQEKKHAGAIQVSVVISAYHKFHDHLSR